MNGARWLDRMGAWAAAPTAAVDDLGTVITARTALAAKVKLDELVALAGAEPIGPVSLDVSRSHAFATEPPLECVLAEVSIIRLRHPNPFPEIRLFRWLP